VCRACGRPPEFVTPQDKARFENHIRGRLPGLGIRPNQMCGCGNH